MKPKCGCTEYVLCDRCAIILMMKILYSFRNGIKNDTTTTTNTEPK